MKRMQVKGKPTFLFSLFPTFLYYLLQKLCNELHGIDYIEHRHYLKEWIDYEKALRQKRLKSEYIDEYFNV